jgi:hypothetical protein
VSQFPMGCYYAAEVMGPEAIMTTILNQWDATQRESWGSWRSCLRFPNRRNAAHTGCAGQSISVPPFSLGVMEIVSVIPEPMERRTYGMCGVIHFYASVFLGLLLLSLVLTDAWDLGPLASVWVWPAHGAVTKHRAHWVAAGRGG